VFFVFSSLFGKKGERKKTENKTPASKAPIAPQQAKPSPAKSATPVASPQDEDSLDFSTYTPPPLSAPLQVSPAPAPAPQSAPQQAEAAPAPPPLDVSALASSLAVQAMALGSVTTAPAVPHAQQAAAPRGEHPPDPVLSIDVSPAPKDVAPVIEETATLFANGQDERALSVLSRSVREGELGDSALQAWLMLFDLYQHLGMELEFEALALEFVVKFERSPPAWIETGERKDPALATGGIAYFALGGTLNDASAPELEKLRNAAATRQALRVECGELEGVDGPGCRLFRETLLSLRHAGKEVLLTGEARLIQFLEEACQPGRIEPDGAVWALLLDIYRILGFQDKFEEAAVNYAVTFEVSPPSWEFPPGAQAGGSAVLPPVEAPDQALILSGELNGASETLAKQLQDWAVANKMLVIDMSRATRVDRVTAGLMLNVLSKLQETGTPIQIHGANELIRALFGVTGLSKVARIVPRK
jgi:anti-anti-sigma regulatory factor